MIDLNNTLLVPVSVEAFVVNDFVRKSGKLRRWQMEFNRLTRERRSPEAAPFDDSDSQVENGVYLHWHLPSALKNGQQQANGELEFPLLPNRWLVVRLSSPAATPQVKSWLIKSDALGEASPENSSRYVRQSGDSLKIERLGSSSPIVDWPSMEETEANLFLTALGYGHTDFLAYQPFHNNVFSFCDRLQDLEAKQVTDQPLNYLVLGWYSNSTCDILHRQTLSALQWSLQDGTIPGNQPATSLYHGLVYGIKYAEARHAVEQVKNVQIAVGNNSIEAFNALVKKWAQYKGLSAEALHADLLKAFQYDMLSALDAADGEHSFPLEVQKNWFTTHPGGITWEISNSPSTPEEADFLRELNTIQTQFEQQQRVLKGLQQQLYEIWWKSKLPNLYIQQLIPDFAAKEQTYRQMFASEISRLQSAILTQKQELGALFSKFSGLEGITYNTAPQEMAEKLNLYAQKRQILQTGHTLKYHPKSPFWQPNEPVVMITGIQAPLPNADEEFYCRLPEQVVNSGDTPDISTWLQQAPELVKKLFREFLGVSYGVGSCQGVRGAGLARKKWAQPWQPLFLEWEVVWYPIPHENWTFDGLDFQFTGTYRQEENSGYKIKGRTLVTPHNSYLLKRKLEQYIATVDKTAITDDVQGFLKGMQQWDFISQRLAGFNNQLAQRTADFVISPDAEIRDSVETNYTFLPNIVNTTRYSQDLRQGQFYINQLMVYDSFGQAVVLVQDPSSKYPGLNSADLLRPIAEENLQPTPAGKTVVSRNAFRFLQLPPRVLRPSRLNLTFKDIQEESGSGEVNPVCGWLIPDRLRRGILAYNQSGALLGMLYPGTAGVRWISAPMQTAEANNNTFNSLLKKLQSLSLDEFQSFTAVIDKTLWTINPTGAKEQSDLSVFVGRPLAVVSGKLSLELAGLDLQDPFWPGPPSKTDGQLTSQQFEVKVGDPFIRKDGVIGYFKEEEFSKFYASEVAEVSEFVQKAGPGNYPRLSFAPDSKVGLTILLDPTAQIHVKTGILPPVTISLPEKVVQQALQEVDILLRCGPLLTEVTHEIDQTAKVPQCLQPVISLPKIPQTLGVWSWLQQNQGGAWQEYGCKEAPVLPTFNEIRANITEGFLRLKQKSHEEEE